MHVVATYFQHFRKGDRINQQFATKAKKSPEFAIFTSPKFFQKASCFHLSMAWMRLSSQVYADAVAL